ncbi:MAG: hypothetical protein JEY79_05810 [Pseudodesulfovibrio sp.]|nr:hypothetical protein [Pseudodesulfovibrio sp.]
MSVRPAITFAIQGIVDPEYVDYADRIVYAASVFSDDLDGVEIGLHGHMAESLAERVLLPHVFESLECFSRNTLHFAMHPLHPLTEKDIGAIVRMCSVLFERGLVRGASFHLDMEPCFERVQAAVPEGLPLSFENLDIQSPGFGSLEAVSNAAGRFPSWGIVLDIAHVVEMQVLGGVGVGEFFDALSNRISQIHFSLPGHHYPKQVLWSGFKAMHSFAFLDGEAAKKAYHAAPLGTVENITLEGVLPPNREDFLREEIRFLRQGWLS